jgi:predicted enzyme related to lactoylglutathione lyase
MTPTLARVILYVKDIPGVAAFYERHFGLRPHGVPTTGWLELSPAGGGCRIALHKAAKSQRSGAAMKLVFGVRDIAAFKAKCAVDGLVFGPTHAGDGFEFANAKDPAGNAISISSRGLK